MKRNFAKSNTCRHNSFLFFLIRLKKKITYHFEYQYMWIIKMYNKKKKKVKMEAYIFSLDIDKLFKTIEG